MSSQSYIYNPQEDRIAATGAGFQVPRLTSLQRLTTSVGVGDAGLTVFDTSLRQFFIWTGVAWVASSGDATRLSLVGGQPEVSMNGSFVGTRITTNISSFAAGAGQFSVWLRTLVVSPSGSARTLFVLSSNSGATPIQANSFIVYITSSGDLEARIYGAATTDFRAATVAGFLTGNLNNVTDIVVTRIGNSLKLYVNGIDTSYSESTGGTPPNWSGSVTADFLHLGPATTISSIYNSGFYRFAMYNRGLSATDVADLVINGVSYADQWSSTTPLLNATFTGSVDGFAAAGTGVTIASVGGKLVVTTLNPSGGGTTRTGVIIGGKNYRCSYKARISLGSGVSLQFRGGGATFTTLGGTSDLNTLTGVEQTFSTDFNSGAQISLYFRVITSVINTDVELDDIVVTRLGAFIDLDFSAGVGFQIPDVTPNALSAVMFGASEWNQPTRSGLITWTATANAGEQVLGGSSIPTNANIEYVVVENVNAGVGVTFSLGSAAGTLTDLINAAAIGGNGTRTVIDPALSFSSTGNLWVSWSAVGTVKVTIVYTVVL